MRPTTAWLFDTAPSPFIGSKAGDTKQKDLERCNCTVSMKDIPATVFLEWSVGGG
jgi:hypothetical protein